MGAASGDGVHDESPGFAGEHAKREYNWTPIFMTSQPHHGFVESYHRTSHPVAWEILRRLDRRPARRARCSMYGCHDGTVSLKHYEAYIGDLMQLMALATRGELARALRDDLTLTEGMHKSTNIQAHAIVTTPSSDGSSITTIASAHGDGGAETTTIGPGGDQRRAVAGQAGDVVDAWGLSRASVRVIAGRMVMRQRASLDVRLL
jgi:hypothetical protein